MMDRHRMLLIGASPTTAFAGPWGLHSSLKVFVDATGQAVRYCGLSHFRGLDRWVRGERCWSWIHRHFPSVNVLRVWPYVDWAVNGWDAPPIDATIAFIQDALRNGFGIELTLLTSNDPRRIEWANFYIRELDRTALPNLLLEAGNEPSATINSIEVEKLYFELDASRYLWSSGLYTAEDQRQNRWGGIYGTAHTPRDYKFAVHGHDLWEYFDGAGPDVAHSRWEGPWVGDEPIRPDQVNGVQPGGWDKYATYRMLGGCYALFGAGGTFHYEGGKQAVEPNADEQQCGDEFFRGLTAFPANAPLGPYTGTIPEFPRVDVSRTYPVGNYMVRCYPVVGTPPPEGWTAIDAEGILCRR